ncbi:MAG: hypothetical protein ABDI07_11405, partial [Candidatus Kryptonium sp.]
AQQYQEQQREQPAIPKIFFETPDVEEAALRKYANELYNIRASEMGISDSTIPGIWPLYPEEIIKSMREVDFKRPLEEEGIQSPTLEVSENFEDSVSRDDNLKHPIQPNHPFPDLIAAQATFRARKEFVKRLVDEINQIKNLKEEGKLTEADSQLADHMIKIAGMMVAMVAEMEKLNNVSVDKKYLVEREAVVKRALKAEQLLEALTKHYTHARYYSFEYINSIKERIDEIIRDIKEELEVLDVRVHYARLQAD